MTERDTGSAGEEGGGGRVWLFVGGVSVPGGLRWSWVCEVSARGDTIPWHTSLFIWRCLPPPLPCPVLLGRCGEGHLAPVLYDSVAGGEGGRGKECVNV